MRQSQARRIHIVPLERRTPAFHEFDGYQPVSYACGWCNKKPVADAWAVCEDCALLDLQPPAFVDMKMDGRNVLHKDIVFYVNGDAPKSVIAPDVILAYAHMRVEKQQAEIDALKKELADMRRVMSEFIDRCDLSPDGPAAQETIERTFKMYKASLPGP